jgi:hypothetical protein
LLEKILVNSPDPDVTSAARLHVTWAGEIEAEQTHRERVVDELLKAQQLGQNDRLAVELLKLGTVPPCFISEWVPPNKIVERLDLPHMPLEYKIQFLERLARADRLDIVVPVAGSIDTPPLLLTQLIGSVHVAIRDTARNNPSCPPAAIELIDREYAIAANWETPPERLDQLAIDCHQEVSAYYQGIKQAYNSQEVVEGWILDANYLRSIVEHPHICLDTLMRLSTYPNPNVRLAVGLNQKTPEEIRCTILEQLACHPILLDYQYLFRHNLETKIKISRDINTPISILGKMVENEFIQTKVRVEPIRFG